jgi:hypothetical protein
VSLWLKLPDFAKARIERCVPDTQRPVDNGDKQFALSRAQQAVM